MRGECKTIRGVPINALEARPLVKNGYLVDLLVAKSTVEQPSSSRSASQTTKGSDINDSSASKTNHLGRLG